MSNESERIQTLKDYIDGLKSKLSEDLDESGKAEALNGYITGMASLLLKALNKSDRIAWLQEYITTLKAQLLRLEFAVTSVTVDGISVTYDAEKLAKEIYRREQELAGLVNSGVRNASIRTGSLW